MKLQDYFKKTLEDLFLNTKFALNKEQYQTILNDYCQGVAKVQKYNNENNNECIIIIFEFEDIVFKYEMIVGESISFKKIIEINYIEEKE